MISAPCFVSPSARFLSRWPLSLTAAPSNPLLRAAGGPATTDTSDARGRKFTWRWTRWDNFLALHITPDDEHERDQVAVLSQAAQEATGESVELAFEDQGYTGDAAEADAASYGIHLHVVSLPEAKRGFVLLPRRWVVERSYGWMARSRRLARDYERLSETLKRLHYAAFSILMLHKAAPSFQWCYNTL